MRYDIEFGKWVREHPTDVSAVGINALLDEIDRLNAYALRLLSDETRTWHCKKCGHDFLSNALVGKNHADCPECETPMRPKAEMMREEIDRLTARVSELEAMTSTDGFTRYLVNQLKDNPELQKSYAKAASDVAEYTEVIHKQALRINELTAEVEKHRWIPVSERLPIPSQKSDGYCSDSSDLVHVYPSPKNDRAVCYLHYLEKWSCSAEVTVTHWMPLPEPPKEETK